MAQFEFDAPEILVTGHLPLNVIARDVDLDGDNDLLVPCLGSQTLVIHWNDGRGGFSPAVHFPLAAAPNGGTGENVMGFGDLNGDCLPDIVVPSSTISTVLLADGAGGFTMQPLPFSTGEIVAADVDADEDLDLVMAGAGSSIRTVLNDGAANFTQGSVTNVGFLVGFGVGDFNEDGSADLCHGAFGCFTNNWFVRFANGSGGFGGPVPNHVTGCDPGNPLIADVTGDGHLDMVVAGRGYPYDGNVLGGSGTGTFQSILDLPGGYQVGDFDRDGVIDVTSSGSNSGEHNIYRGNGAGGFLQPVLVTNLHFRRAADLNGDGASDFMRVIWGIDWIEIVTNRSIEWVQDPVGGKWYALTRRSTWAEAVLDARSLGGELVTIDSATENQFISSTFGIDFFIGYSDAAVEGQWEWIAGDPVGYENWAPGEPDNVGDADFCRLGPAGLWFDAPAATELRGIVELASADCNMNGRPDAFEIAVGWAQDVNGDGIPDACTSPYFCPANTNSSGGPAQIEVSGTPAVGIDTVHLDVTGLPANRFGYFLMSDSIGYIPMVGGGQGDLCLGLPFVRFADDVLNSGASGTMSYTPDLVSVPGATVTQGSTWQFQCWFRDQNPTPTSNLSNAVGVTFSADPAPVASFSPPCTGLEEQFVQFTIAVELSFAHDQPVVVPYALSGTATDQVDWRVESPNPLVIPAGHTSWTLTITVADDGAIEPTETGRIELVPSSTARVGTGGVYELTIRDND
ncbi:MAG: hypothetical protein GY711_04315 [bacterium]|nr:hypothetical protein [bacterium]